MNTPEEDTRLTVCLRVTRIIISALVIGVVVCGVVFVAMRQQQNQPAAADPFITYIALGFAAFQVMLQAVVPGLMTTGLRRQIAAGKWPPANPGRPVPPDDLGKLCGLFQTRLIVGAALVEGAAFFLLIAYFLEGSELALAGAGVMLALLLVRFPTRPGLESWLSDQHELLRQDRMAV
jgi:hypothetical protein